MSAGNGSLTHDIHPQHKFILEHLDFKKYTIIAENPPPNIPKTVIKKAPLRSSQSP
jgi:hypothetical protein